ncbi:hypothetical protein DPMN_059867 [Dreissena polymorpha]|uniref:Immunoglobulin I-set domain-containing protein n=1 Tax=Dreissena polymorpha TaxID=45954 RepID=A0A9D4C4W7_DREPO|nr:hypothetical protein DPMN_059867 [Dreissena polymorpha]
MDSTPDGVHRLSILEAFPKDTGTYKTVARNKAGEITVTCHLKVFGELWLLFFYSGKKQVRGVSCQPT